MLQNLTSYVDIKMILLFEELCESNYIQGVDISNITSSKELEELINYGMTKKILNQERKLIETVFENLSDDRLPFVPAPNKIDPIDAAVPVLTVRISDLM